MPPTLLGNLVRNILLSPEWFINRLFGRVVAAVCERRLFQISQGRMIQGSGSMSGRGGFTPPLGEVNSPLQPQIAPLPDSGEIGPSSVQSTPAETKGRTPNPTKTGT